MSVAAHTLPPPGAHLGEIVLNRADKRNALTPQMLRAIRDHLARFESDDAVRAVVLRGNGAVFCAGFDLDLCRGSSDALRDLLTELSLTVRAMRRSPKPIVVAAHGAAIAGGCALLGGADVIVTDADARLGYPVVLLGISPAVTAPLLRAAIGNTATRRHLLDPSVFDGERAREIGLASLCVALPEDVVPRAQIEADALAAKPPAAYAATKAWLNQIEGSADDATFDAALDASLALVGSPEERERLDKMWAARPG